jgi:hypothetical protein
MYLKFLLLNFFVFVIGKLIRILSEHQNSRTSKTEMWNFFASTFSNLFSKSSNEEKAQPSAVFTHGITTISGAIPSPSCDLPSFVPEVCIENRVGEILKSYPHLGKDKEEVIINMRRRDELRKRILSLGPP